MDQPGVEIRPIRQITGDADFNEVFFHDARTPAANIVGEPNQGWKVAMGTLAFERGASTFGQQLGFTNEFDAAVELARKTGRLDDPALRQRVADAWIGLRIMRLNGMRMLSNPDPASAEAMISKLFWSNWHRDFGELAVDLAGLDATTTGTGYELSAEQQVFMFSRSDTIYAGSNEIQRNIIGERALALPKEPR
jgi:alkylation response protein AidB-like acyl-CoA dehydrogenase